jgi:hypothetical protein
MKPGIKRTSAAFITLLLLFGFAGVGRTQAAEFSADMALTSKEGGRMNDIKIYVKNNRMRQEFSEGAGRQVSISRPDKNLVWFVMPDEKMYMESDLSTDKNSMKEWKVENEQKAKFVGKETVNGFACKKYEVKEGGDTVTTWISEELNYPIKSKGKDWEFELKNIKKGGVADSLFEVPAGYRKMEIPTMPQQQ